MRHPVVSCHRRACFIERSEQKHTSGGTTATQENSMDELPGTITWRVVPIDPAAGAHYFDALILRHHPPHLPQSATPEELAAFMRDRGDLAWRVAGPKGRLPRSCIHQPARASRRFLKGSRRRISACRRLRDSHSNGWSVAMQTCARFKGENDCASSSQP